VKLLDGVAEVVVDHGVVAVVELFPRPQDSMSGWAGPEMQSAQSNWKHKKGLVSVYNFLPICQHILKHLINDIGEHKQQHQDLRLHFCETCLGNSLCSILMSTFLHNCEKENISTG
jgi:hypothetical protein